MSELSDTFRARWRLWGAALVAVVVTVALSSRTEALPDGTTAQAYVEGLQFPTAMSVADNGDILVAEKLGGVRVIRDGELVEEPVTEFRVAPQNEGGLIGIEPIPDYGSSGEALVLYTPQDDLEHIYVSKIKIDGESAIVLEEKWLEFPSRPPTDRHYGGGMVFGPDGYLYIGLGELREKDRSQNTDVVSGSILRYTADGEIPEDNPLEGSPIYAWGLRNPFGVSVNSEGRVWVSENGADIADEINILSEGANFGWPLVRGRCDEFPKNEPCDMAGEYVAPAYEFKTVVGPTGLVEYEGEMLPELQGRLLIGGWHSRWIHQFEVGEDGDLTQQPPLFRLDGWESGGSGSSSFTDLTVADDGAILVLESGRMAGRIIRIASEDETLEGRDNLGEEPSSAGEDSSDDAGSGCGGCSQTGDAPGVLLHFLILGLGLWATRRLT